MWVSMWDRPTSMGVGGAGSAAKGIQGDAARPTCAAPLPQPLRTPGAEHLAQRDPDPFVMSKYELGQRVLAYHGPLLYEAKILKIFDPDSRKVIAKKHTRDGRELVAALSASSQVPRAVADSADMAFFIHYQGWKTSWDEWVFEERLMPFNKENETVAQELKDQFVKSGKATPESGAIQKEPSPSAPSVKKQSAPKRPKKDPTLMPEEEFVATPEVYIRMPPALKAALIDDWEFVTKDQKVVPLPRTPNVEAVLDKYTAFQFGKKITSGHREILLEVKRGLLTYFNKCLGTLLLYRQERQQYFEHYSQAKAADDAEPFVPSQVYGCEHLLRLFVTLPGLIAQTAMDQDAVATLRKQCEELMEWIVEHESELLLKEYVLGE